MLRAMRGIRAAASIACLGAWAGCSFESPRLPASTDDAPPADPDAPPDAPYVPACMADATYTANPLTGRRYKIHAQNVNYDAAIDRCAADGAHLAVVDDLVENTYLSDLLANDAWIGFDDLTEEGAYKWITGAPGYDGFRNPEPNNDSNEDCAVLRTNGNWHDFGCEAGLHAICECDPSFRPPPTPACRTATSGFFERSGRRVFPGPAATFVAAKAACEAMGAHLLVIGDADENTEMDQMLPLAHWLGYTDLASEGTFRWVNTAPSPYVNWVGGTVPQEDDIDCAVLQDGGLWSNVDCATTNPYACECDPAPP